LQFSIGYIIVCFVYPARVFSQVPRYELYIWIWITTRRNFTKSSIPSQFVFCYFDGKIFKLLFAHSRTPTDTIHLIQDGQKCCPFIGVMKGVIFD